MPGASTEEVIRGFSGSLRSFIRARVHPSELEDVEQDVYLRMHRAVGELRDEQRVEAWMYRIARSAVIDRYRARGRDACRQELDDSIAATEDESADLPTAERELATCVEPFLAALPASYREALRLTEIEGLTQRQAADKLGLSLSGMKSRVQRGRAMLREAFEACCDIGLDARGRVLEYVPREKADAKDCRA